MHVAFIVVFIIFISPFSWACDREQAKLTLAELTWVTEDYPPYNYINKEGELKGIFTDILLLVYQELDIDINKQDITVIPWARLYHQLTYEQGIAAFSMTNTDERDKRFKLIPLPYSGKISIMVKRNRKSALASKKLAEMTIAVVREDIGHHLLNFHDIPSTQVHTTSAQSMLKMLLHDRVDAIAYAEDVVHFQFKKLELGTDEIVSFHTLADNKLNNYIFHRNTDKCITTLFASVIDDLHERGELDAVFAQYLY